MNKQLYSILTMLCVVIFTVQVNATSVIPVKRDTSTKWCLMDEKGKTYLNDLYEGMLYTTGEGTFGVLQDKDSTWSLYVFDKKNPRLIADNLAEVGNFSEGVIAVMRAKNKPIEIIDKRGKTILTVDSLCGNIITECGYCHDGRFVVTTIDEIGNKKVGMLDLLGKTVLEPEYDEIISCANGNYVSMKDSKIYITDGKGGHRILYTYQDKKTYRFDNYIILPTTIATMIIDRNTMENVATLPKGSYVQDVYNGYVAYGNYSFNGVNVYNIKTKHTIQFPDYDLITISRKGFLAVTKFDQDSIKLMSFDGKLIKQTDWNVSERYNDFIIVTKVSDDPSAKQSYLFDENLKPISKDDFINIANPTDFDRSYEYSPHRELSIKLIASIMVRNLPDALVYICKSTSTYPLENYRPDDIIFFGDIQKITCSAIKRNGVITEVYMTYNRFETSGNVSMYLYDDATFAEYRILYKELCSLMDKVFVKISEGVYDDNGVQYTVRENTFDSDFDGMSGHIFVSAGLENLLHR